GWAPLITTTPGAAARTGVPGSALMSMPVCQSFRRRPKVDVTGPSTGQTNTTPSSSTSGTPSSMCAGARGTAARAPLRPGSAPTRGRRAPRRAWPPWGRRWRRPTRSTRRRAPRRLDRASRRHDARPTSRLELGETNPERREAPSRRQPPDRHLLHPRERRSLLQLSHELLDDRARPLGPRADAAVLEVRHETGEAEVLGTALDVVPVADALHVARDADLRC